MKPLSLYKIGCLNYNVRYVENEPVVLEISIFLLPKSKGTVLLFVSSSRKQLFTSSSAVPNSSQNYPFMKISHLHKGIPMAVNGGSLAFPVRAEIFMSSLKNNSFQ